MATDLFRVECRLHNDSRLLQSAVVVVLRSAQRAGLSTQMQEDLVTAVTDICRDAFERIDYQTAQPWIRLVVDDFRDRIEVTIEAPGDISMPRTKLFSAIPVTEAAKGSGESMRGGVDRVECEGSDGSRIKLIKYRGAAKPKPVD